MAKERVAFRTHAIVYIAVNAMLLLIWWTNAGGRRPTFADSSDAYFWPIWPLLGWGIGLTMHGWRAYGGGHDAVSREEAKLREKYGER